MRSSNTDVRGAGFTREQIVAVWCRGQDVPGYNPALTRKDACGAFINLTEYGMTTTFGWEVDHVLPVARGGGDEIANLQPLYWRNNRHKGDDWPGWSCGFAA